MDLNDDLMWKYRCKLFDSKEFLDAKETYDSINELEKIVCNGE